MPKIDALSVQNYRSNKGMYNHPANNMGGSVAARSMTGSVTKGLDNPLLPLPKANVPHMKRLINN